MNSEINNKLRIDNLRRMVLLSYYYKKYNDDANYEEIQRDLIKKAGSKNLVYNFTFAHLCFLCDNDYMDCSYFDGVPLEEKISEKGERFISNYFSNPDLTFEDFEKQEILNNLDSRTKAIINLYIEDKHNNIIENINSLNIDTKDKEKTINLIKNIDKFDEDTLINNTKEILNTTSIENTSTIIAKAFKTILSN